MTGTVDRSHLRNTGMFLRFLTLGQLSEMLTHPENIFWGEKRADFNNKPGNIRELSLHDCILVLCTEGRQVLTGTVAWSNLRNAGMLLVGCFIWVSCPKCLETLRTFGGGG